MFQVGTQYVSNCIFKMYIVGMPHPRLFPSEGTVVSAFSPIGLEFIDNIFVVCANLKPRKINNDFL